MSQWYCKELGDGIQAFAPSDEIQNSFVPVFTAAGQPIDLAIFSRYDLKENKVTVYFSPAAVSLAKSFNATPCQKPTLKDLALFLGDQRSIGVLFPETQKY